MNGIRFLLSFNYIESFHISELNMKYGNETDVRSFIQGERT